LSRYYEGSGSCEDDYVTSAYFYTSSLYSEYYDVYCFSGHVLLAHASAELGGFDYIGFASRCTSTGYYDGYLSSAETGCGFDSPDEPDLSFTNPNTEVLMNPPSLGHISSPAYFAIAYFISVDDLYYEYFPDVANYAYGLLLNHCDPIYDDDWKPTGAYSIYTFNGKKCRRTTSI
jgi:hypothetical protein